MITQSTAAGACHSPQCLLDRPRNCDQQQARTTQPYCSSNQVTVRPPRLRHPHRAASPATSPSPRPASASSPAGRSSGAPGPLRSVTSIRTTPARAVTVTVTVSPGRPELLYRTLLPKSSLFTELPDGFPQVRGHAGGFGVRDFYLRAGYVLLPCSREAEVPRDLVNLVVPQRGGLVATGERQEPFRLVDGDGLVVAAAAEFFCDLQAAGRPTRRSGLTGWTCCGGSGSCGRRVSGGTGRRGPRHVTSAGG